MESKAMKWILSITLVLSLMLGQLPGDPTASAAVTKNVYSFGKGEFGRLGQGDSANRLAPAAISELSGLNIKAVSAGAEHTLVLTADGDVYSFGNGAFGRLGHGDESDKTVPTLIPLFHNNIVATAVAAGTSHSLVLSAGGDVYAFGAGGTGRLGTGTSTNVLAPVKIGGDLTGKQAIAISAGDAHSLVLTNDGSVYSFGAGNSGRLGHNDMANQLMPKQIDALPAVSAISAGIYHSLAVSVTGSVYAFGHGALNRLGLNSTSNVLFPTPIPGLASEHVTAVSAGNSHSLALTANGDVYSFGNEFVGQLGHGTNDEQPVPKKIDALAAFDIVAISTGTSHSVVLTDEGDVYAFGAGAEGQLGRGSAITGTNLPLGIVWTAKGSLIDAGGYHTIVAGGEDDGFTYSVAASVDEIEFYHRNVGYSAFAATTVTVTNNGTGPITGLVPTLSSPDFEIAASPGVALNAPGNSTTLSVRPVAGLAPGIHTGTLTLSADRGVTETIDLSFEVTATPTFSFELTPPGDVTFPTSGLGYISDHTTAVPKNLIRTGTGDIHVQSIELLGGSASAFYVGTLHATDPTILSDSAMAINFPVRQKEHLPVGTYSDTVRITTDHGNLEFDLFFEVQGAPVIGTHPEDATVYAGEDATFSVSATGTGLSYQWQVDDGSGFANIPSGTSATLTLDDVTPAMSGNQYRVVVNGTIAPPATSNAATLQVRPGAPTNVAATAGDGRVRLTWGPVPGATGYNVYRSTTVGSEGSLIASVTGSEYAYDAIGLTNGTTYYFVVKATNADGEGRASIQASAQPSRSGGGSSGSSSSSSSTGSDKPDLSAVVWVNGVPQSIGTIESTRQGDRTIATVRIDEAALEAKLATEGRGAIVLIYSNVEADSFVAELNGRMLGMLAERGAILEIRTDSATYAIPADLIDWSAIAGSFETGALPENVKLLISVSKPSAQMIKLADDAAKKGLFEIVVPAIEFNVAASFDGKTYPIDRFADYVERRIVVPAGAAPSRIATGVVIEPDGSVRHVPTKIVQIDGRSYASVFSLTNSVYALVANEVSFADVENHWSKDEVNEMGSRLILTGTDSDTFAPNAYVTRAQFASIVARALGLKPDVSKQAAFQDVAPTNAHYGDIQAAVSYGLITGGGTFHPGERITREQMMVIVAKAMKLVGASSGAAADKSLERFEDADQVSDLARESIADVVSAGISQGRSTTKLAPKGLLTRAEAAAIIERLLRRANRI
ncbi:alpha-tubulin suppressor-like RCC1 family protein [Cohnella sp. SGD-V74]|uniref:RCC1 domain-containing protein n=1 Tax=unclassified Cohnella TaxID=2636738 RepID=UPI000D45A0B6|nr:MULTISPECIES: S-layer homology domain-containing protein [unclassified Cohnella]PRX74084.1 alpha-tubulin suppressor-like RCC1 family protein [Cohnella sp. SGD-V74]